MYRVVLYCVVSSHVFIAIAIAIAMSLFCLSFSGAACVSTRAEIEQLKTDKAMIIGLQVRLGDHVFDPAYRRLSPSGECSAVQCDSFPC